MSVPQLSIRCFDSSLNLLTELDTYESAYFSRSWYDIGDFAIKINWNLTDAAGFRFASYFTIGNYVLFGTDYLKIGQILEIEKTVDQGGKGSQFVTVKGKEAKTILTQRLVEPTTTANYTAVGVAETVIKNLVKSQIGSTATANRIHPLVNVTTDQTRGSSVTVSSRFVMLSEEIRKAALASSMGSSFSFNPTTKLLDFECYEGTDRTASQSVNPRMIISTDYDTLKSASVKTSYATYKNLVYAAGQGIGTARNIRKVYSGTEPSGAARREVFSDMRELFTSTEIDAKGANVLAGLTTQKFIDAKALVYSQYVLGTDYNLGDIVTVKAYDENLDTRITAVKESWANLSYEIDLTFDKPYPELPKQIQSNVFNATQVQNNSETGISQTTITSTYTIENSEKLVLVNTNNAVTINIPTGLPIGKELEVQRVSSGLTTNAVTLSFTGETIYAASSIALFGNTLAKFVKYTEHFVIRKITSTTWELIAGEDSGANTNGDYINSYNKKSKQTGIVSQSLATTTFVGNLYISPSYSVSLPYTFKTGSPHVNTFFVPYSSEAQWIAGSATADTESTLYYRAWCFASATATRDILWTSQGYWI